MTKKKFSKIIDRMIESDCWFLYGKVTIDLKKRFGKKFKRQIVSHCYNNKLVRFDDFQYK